MPLSDLVNVSDRQLAETRTSTLVIEGGSA